MKKRILRAMVAISLIVTLTIANFILLGANVVSYALGILNQTSETSNKNIKFSTYFKTEDGQKTDVKEEKITSNDMKLYMEISVQDEGYFNGEVEILNSNFTIKDQKLSEEINKIDKNKVSLNQINSGETVEVELEIFPKTGDIIDFNLLNMESEVKLTGIYTDSKARKISVEAIKNVQLILEDPYEENEGINLDAEVITNKIYNIDGVAKRLVQLKVKSNLEGNLYPIKSTNLEINVPEVAEDVKVISIGTRATNGKEAEDFTEESWEYVREDNKLNINIQNTNQDGKISWNKNVKDELVITYILPEDIEITNTQINVKDTIELYNSNSTTKEDENIVTVEEEKDGTFEIKSSNSENSIYKGKIYAKQEREYKTNVDLYVNYPEISNGLEVLEGQSTYLTDNNELTANVQYKKTEINKEKLLQVLGQEGYITIEDQNGRTIANITSNLEADEKGNIVINYENGVKEITIKTTTPEKAGIIEITHTKVICSEEYEIETIKEIKKLKQNIYAKYNEIIVTNSNEITLNETTTKAKLEINRKDLSTMVKNENVEIRATLVNNSEKYDLYKNPTLKIELPRQVESIDVKSINLLYEDKLKVKDAKMYEDNGIKIIEIKLEGEQTDYFDSELTQGATVIINSSITLDKKATNSIEKIKMTYTNEKAVSYENSQEEKEIEIVAPTGMVVANTMTASNISAIGEEETITKYIGVQDEAKQEEVKIEVINNNEAEVKDISVLGSFPTRSDENTIQSTITREIQTQGIDESKVRVYYSEKEDVTEELTKENGWTETITNNQEVKSYLISVASMEAGENLTATYGVGIPGGLGYNEQAYENYAVTYNDTLTGQKEEVKSTPLGVSTGIGPELKAILTAEVAGEELKDGDTVSEGEIITYKVKIENVGTEDAINVLLNENAPEGTTLKVEGNKTIETISVGQSIEEEYKVYVNQDIKPGTAITNKIKMQYNNITVESNELKLISQSRDIVLDLYQKAYEQKENLALKAGYGTFITLKVTNNSNEDKENVIVQIINNDIFTISEIIDNNENEIDLKNKTINIKSLKKNSTVCIDIGIIANKDINVEEADISAKVKSDDKTYRSNVLTYTINKVMLELTQISDTNNQYLKDGDKIIYTIKLKNSGKIDISNITLLDEIPGILTVLSIEKDGKVIEQFTKEETKINEISNSIKKSGINLKPGEETEFKITALVENGTQTNKTIKISNIAKATYDSSLIESEEITHLISALSTNAPSGDNSGNSNNEGTNVDSINTYTVSGTAWLDKDENGKIDSNEEILSGVTAELVDIETNEIAKDVNGNKIKTTTDNNGFYSLERIPKGKYIVVFEYDTSKYIPTTYQVDGTDESKNSNVVLNRIKIDGQERTVASTDTLIIQDKSISNINIGLKEIKTFSLKLDKNLSKITVQTKKQTKTYDYNNTTFAKIELPSKEMKNANMIIEYEIKITNIGDAEGYVRNVVDYMPSGMKFNSELNKDWYKLDSNLYNTSLANEVILPGETKTLKLVLTKIITSENAEIANNIAEIAESYSTSGLQDLNSTSGNRVQGESDMGTADIVIGIATGEIVVNVALITILTLLTIGAGIYLINKKVIKFRI